MLKNELDRVNDKLDRAESEKARNPSCTYRKPELISFGTACELVQGTPYGAYADSYTGYKWNR